MTAHKHTPMVVAAARALCRRDSDLCNVDFDDNWKFYGDGFLMDAQVALESAAAPELLEACQTFSEWLRREEAGFPAETRFDTPDGEAKWREWYFENLRICDLAQALALAAIAKATGGAA